MANAFLDSYIQGGEQARRQSLADMENAQKGVQIRGALEKLQLEQNLRAELSQADTPEKQAAVAIKYGGPSAIMGHLDRQQRAKDTKEMALSRLSQIAAKAETDHERAMAGLTRQQDKDAELARHNRILEQINAEKLKYDTGAIVNVPGPVAPPAAPQAAPQGYTPQEQQALELVRTGQATSARATPQGAEVVRGQPTPQMAPQPVVAPPTPAPMTGGGIPASSILPTVDEARANPVTPTPAAPATPTMPAIIANSPKKIQDKWLADQAKAGNAGSAPDTVVDAIVQGRMQMPTGFALRSPYWQNVIERVAAKDPNFDATKYGARQAAARTFSSGPEARNVTALNTVIGHLGTLDEAATALDNKDLRAFNAVANRMATEMGDPRITNFDTARQAVAEETMRVFRQVGASESEAKRWGDLISSSNSPKQLKGNISTLGNLLDSRVQAISQQYERTVTQGGNPARVDPKNVETLDRLRGKTPTLRSGDEALINKYLK